MYAVGNIRYVRPFENVRQTIKPFNSQQWSVLTSEVGAMLASLETMQGTE